MSPLSILPANAPTSTGAVVLGGPAPESAATADFEGILAAQSAVALAADTSAGGDDTHLPAVPAPGALTTVLPPPGKVLPDALPLTTPVAAPDEPAPLSQADTEKNIRPIQASPLPATRATDGPTHPAAKPPRTEPAAELDERDGTAPMDQPPTPPTLATASEPPTPALAPASTRTSPDVTVIAIAPAITINAPYQGDHPIQSASEPAQPGMTASTAAQLVLPGDRPGRPAKAEAKVSPDHPLPTVNPASLPAAPIDNAAAALLPTARASAAMAPVGPQLSPEAAQPLMPAAADYAPQLVSELKLTGQSHRSGQPVTTGEGDTLAEGAAAFQSVIPQTPGAAPSANSAIAAAPAVHATGTHDFAQVVDRLIAAREASQPQAVSIALRHADFGPIQLHFRQDDGALSVQLASPDPDFARAVTLATAPVQPVPANSVAGDHGSSQHQPARSDQGMASSSDTQSQQRGHSQPGQRDERTGRPAAPGHAVLAERPAGQSARSGIFA